MKRLAVWMMLVACLAIGFTPLQAAAASNSNVSIVIDGKTLNLGNNPAAFVEKGRTLLPVRGVFEELGLDVKWNQKAETATITGDDVTISMKRGAKQVTVNGSTVTVDVPVTMKKNRLFIPVRFVMEHVGVGVEWNPDESTVYLVTDEEEPEGEEPPEEENPGEETPEGEEVADTEAFLKELIEANESLTSFSTDMDIAQTMSFDGETIDMDMGLTMDMVLDPLGFYQHMTMKMEELGDEEMSMESYFTKDGFYTFESTMDQWVKYDDDMFDELMGLSDLQMDPSAQFELMSKFTDDLKVYENDNTYEVHFNVSGEGFQELLDFLFNMPELGLDEEMDILEDLDFNIDHMSIVSTIDKETLFPLSDEIDTKMTVSFEEEEMSITQKINGTYSKHNEIDEIVIPQEVIDSAISFEEYLEQLEAEFGEDLEEVEEVEEDVA